VAKIWPGEELQYGSTRFESSAEEGCVEYEYCYLASVGKAGNI
jgi:hypothetical protein